MMNVVKIVGGLLLAVGVGFFLLVRELGLFIEDVCPYQWDDQESEENDSEGGK
nr:MAG TPA: hypothetical protein [Caudoviricetes sp.]